MDRNAIKAQPDKFRRMGAATRRTIFLSMIIFAVVFCNSNCKSQEMPSVAFKESTFDLFRYANGRLDTVHEKIMVARTEATFKDARIKQVASYLTKDDPRMVVAHYTRLSGQRFYKMGDRFIYTFSEIKKKPASRIEIYPVPIARIQKEYWPTRIDLVLLNKPVKMRVPQSFDWTIEDLKIRAGDLCFPGTLREDIALLEMEETGPKAEIYVIATAEPFESVYTFFRRRVGRIYVINARDGDLNVRDFEIDATSALELEKENQELHIRVEENPVVSDQEGNSQNYLGYTFIKYTFWKNLKHPAQNH
jgi:hypothetical protein